MGYIYIAIWSKKKGQIGPSKLAKWQHNKSGKEGHNFAPGATSVCHRHRAERVCALLCHNWLRRMKGAKRQIRAPADRVRETGGQAAWHVATVDELDVPSTTISSSSGPSQNCWHSTKWFEIAPLPLSLSFLISFESVSRLLPFPTWRNTQSCCCCPSQSLPPATILSSCSWAAVWLSPWERKQQQFPVHTFRLLITLFLLLLLFHRGPSADMLTWLSLFSLYSLSTQPFFFSSGAPYLILKLS